MRVITSVEIIKGNLKTAIELVGDALNSCGEPDRSVRIMAVTKTHPVEITAMAIEAGVALLGENRVSEGGRKIKTLGKDAAEFHMIGPIHTGEVRQAVRDFHWIDSVGRLKIAREIARRTVSKGEEQPGILIEVNTSGEASKHGFDPDYHLLFDVLGEIGELGLHISGLMTVGPLAGTEQDTSAAFALLRDLRDRLVGSCGYDLPELSMGMSDDFVLAVAQGATTIRLGRYLFGPRQTC
ncbi:MAG: YggS family pyridoxal phosphate-dependent enzyme [Candidatus Aegiribacteria sp.]|nr:YggS family pyridoxal phosphate-dependent enzyme [Candidatus Aegiribacteria sp.]